MHKRGNMKVFTYEEIGKHTTRDSCWVVINNKVYDVTGFLQEHPGGEDILVENSGRDATVAFIALAHSPEARELMQKFQIGTVSETKPELEMDSVKFVHSNQKDPSANAFIVPVVLGMIITAAIMYFL